jgi:tetratricopeptide (TPR) repeat protein
MNEINDKSKHGRRLMLAFCAAALAMVQSVTTQAEDKFEMMVHETDLYGARDIETGDYDVGIERLLIRKGGPGQPLRVSSAVSIDLCVAYTMTEQMNKAKEACDEAVESGWYSGLAYNNRGAFHIASGNYEAAIRDFQSATEGNGADKIASRNLQRAQVQLSQQRALGTSAYTVAKHVEVDPQ